MDWKKLLSAKRWGYEHREIKNEDMARSEFQRDYDRLIFSSPFRRLQNKTQVFPLPGSVFVHNRLTHSLEVASVGRSLGRIFYTKYKEDYPEVDREFPYLQEIGNIVSSACLAHDLGNPAFGHSGEAAISFYFSNGDGLRYQNEVSEQEWHDLLHFEGNANALRILTHQFNGKESGGFGLTYSTLAAIVKYPCAAIDGNKKGLGLHRKKYGYFQPEKTSFVKVAEALGMMNDADLPDVYKRHPLVYLVEAADDICYNIIDIEDAHRLSILSYQEVEELLIPLTQDTQIEKRLEAIRDLDSKVSLLRAKAISTLIQQCSTVFFEKEKVILNGKFESSLIDHINPQLREVMERIEKISIAKIYNAQSVVQIEVAGYKVMSGLLEEFVPAYIHNTSAYDKKLVALIPNQYKYPENTTYDKIRSVLDFVSSMTDLYAVELFRKIKGISFPSLD
ncbi:deoxyguanosinetriphosphate triphosphohydrolase [Olivibacter sp. SDN3]|uniref:deoxyguanosinetriphosphate triphosphohydrolase n=1 Tax=Olivibacter sp. SDN3 TaxID=2764720 RepID=UPI00165152A3|nr:deoxyguanosinetriphosphate triphosphohydrolase [Olivibacter sp. SDN3]QNL51005.1 deoxyguanosinetriphosphate triphosphohydrolase [Olivibacter sp. SDN3]